MEETEAQKLIREFREQKEEKQKSEETDGLIFYAVKRIFDTKAPIQIGGAISGLKRRKRLEARLENVATVLIGGLVLDELTLTIIQETERKLFGVVSNVNEYKRFPPLYNRLKQERTASEKIYTETIEKINKTLTDSYIKQRQHELQKEIERIDKKITQSIKLLKV